MPRPSTTNSATPAARWRPLTRIAFRFVVTYFALYSVVNQLLGGVLLLPGFSFAPLGTLWPLRDITTWAAEHLFGAAPPFVYIGNSGDTIFHWVQTALMLALAVAITAAWSVLDRRSQYVTMHKWVRLCLRFALAAQMFYYGMAKIIPTQFAAPSLVTLIEPLGNLSRSDLLWTFIGASTAYEVVTGLAEVAAGLLLLAPQTTPLGALIGMADMIQVFVLNMTYDFGLKQIAFHLMLMFGFLLAPDLRRLASVLVLDRPAGPSSHQPLFATPRANRLALAAQVAFGLYLVAMFTSLSLGYYYGKGGGGYPKSPLYGIWEIEQLSVDGTSQIPLLNEYDRRWRRVIFDAPSTVVFQRTDDSFAHYGATIDEDQRRIALTKGSSRLWKAALTFERPSDDRLILEGRMDDHDVRLRLKLLPLDTFRLLNSTFRWIHPPDPYAG